MSSPAANRSCGGSRSPRTSSHASSPSARRAASGFASRSIPRRARQQLVRDPAERRPQAEVEVERVAMPERDLALDPLELGDRAGRRAGARAQRGVDGRRRARRQRGRGGGQQLAEHDRGEQEHVDVHGELGAARQDGESDDREHERSGRPGTARGGGARLIPSPPARAAPRSRPARSFSASAVAASRSSRTVSSASIASSFISAPTACCENLALSNRSVSGACRSGADTRARRASGRGTPAAPRPACAAGRVRRAPASSRA